MKITLPEICQNYSNLLQQFSAEIQTNLAKKGALVSEKYAFKLEAANFEYWQNIDSTQLRAKQLAHTQLINLIIARCQTKGRGRFGRRFFSPLGGLYFTFTLPLVADLNRLLYTPLLAVSLQQGLATIVKRSCQIKWVNDLYFQKKKVAGIITECVTDKDKSYLVCGVGVNWQAPIGVEVPDLIANRVGNLKLDKEPVTSREHAYLSPLQIDVLKEFFQNLANWQLAYTLGTADFMAVYEENMLAKNEHVQLSNGASVKLIRVDHQDGGLIVLQGEKQLKITSGELSLLIDDKQGVNW